MNRTILVATIFLSLVAHAQKKVPSKTYNLHSEFKYQVEISSMDIIGNTMFVLSESCEYLYQFNIDSLNDSRENIPSMKVHLPFLGGSDVEGLALFDHYVFYINEDGNSIKSFDLETLKPVAIKPNKIKLPKNNSSYRLYTGLEGIDINSELSILYVIQERDKKQETSISRLLAYRIGRKNNEFVLTYLDELEISLEHDFRYSSIALSEDYNSIFLIRSKFIKRSNKGEYFIDKIDFESTSMFSNSKIDMSKIKHFQIDNNKINNANIEGMAHFNNTLYIINDNLESASKNCYKSINKPTYIFTFKDK
ncbi:esterase-like activity of phytase family protein [Flavivirga rizhaonensis]|nr:esterase-like activity of phytase family protein [Flavivirga rizhaonensis]